VQESAEGKIVWRWVRLATMAQSSPDLGVFDRGALAVEDGRITFAGEEAALPHAATQGARIVDCGGRCITPGLIDCHTHLVYGGDRAREFQMRLAGATYEEIAAAGGILSTVRATRAASEDELIRQSLHRLDALIAEGVTTIEIKSGCALDSEGERRMLRAARRLGRERSVRMRSTYLGAHALPPEFAGRRDDYVTLVAGPMIPALAREGLADAVDGFCEGIVRRKKSRASSPPRRRRACR
jgi:imidazolonepropionase